MAKYIWLVSGRWHMRSSHTRKVLHLNLQWATSPSWYFSLPLHVSGVSNDFLHNQDLKALRREGRRRRRETHHEWYQKVHAESCWLRLGKGEWQGSRSLCDCHLHPGKAMLSPPYGAAPPCSQGSGCNERSAPEGSHHPVSARLCHRLAVQP